MHVFAGEVSLLDGILNDNQQLFVVPGFGHIVERALFDGRYRRFDCAHCCNDHNRKSGIEAFDIALNFHSGFSRKHQIQKDEVVMMIFDLAQAFFAVRCGVDR